MFSIVIWLTRKIAYNSFPTPLLFLYVNLRGFILSYISKNRLKTKQNLVAAFGKRKEEREIQHIVRRYFMYQEKLALTLIWPQLRGFSRVRRCPVDGLQHLDAALTQGHGVILLTAHFGYARLIKYILRARGYTVWLVGPKLADSEPDKLTTFGRYVYHKILNMPHFSAFADNDLAASLNIRPLVRALRKNEIILLTADGLRSSTMVDFELLGTIVPLATGSVVLARETEATILPAFAIDSDEDVIGIKLCLEHPLSLSECGDIKDTIRATLQQFATVFESYIERYPHLYRWSKRNYFRKRLRMSRIDLADRYQGKLTEKKRRKKERLRDMTTQSHLESNSI